jgi:phospholipid transport system substrate-binding protein
MIKQTFMTVAAVLLAGTVAAATSDDPDALVKELYNKWLTTARAQQDTLAKNKARLYELTDTVSGPYINYNRLSRLVLGTTWKQASEEQRKRFTTEFRAHLVRTYATAMYTYIDSDFEFKPSNYKPGAKQVIVRTETRPRDGRPKLPVNYVLYNKGDGWQAMDVTIEGISVVATLRNIVRSEVHTKSLDAVIAELAEKNRKAAQQ